MLFENKVTIGNVITAAILFATLVAGYSDLRGQQLRQAERSSAFVEDMRDSAESLDALRTSTDMRVRAVEVVQAGQGSDLRNIQTGINEIKASLEKLVGKP